MLSIVNDLADVSKETSRMKDLMQKFRMEAEVEVVVNAEKYSPTESGWERATDCVKSSLKSLVSGAGTKDQPAVRRKLEKLTKSYVKLGEVVEHFSKNAELIVITLPVPTLSVPPKLYMLWLDALSKSSSLFYC